MSLPHLVNSPRGEPILRWTSRVLALAYAGWLGFLGYAIGLFSGGESGNGLALGVLLIAKIPAVTALVGVWVGWRQEGFAVLFFAVLGVILLCFTTDMGLEGILTVPVPAFVIAALFALHARMHSSCIRMRGVGGAQQGRGGGGDGGRRRGPARQPARRAAGKGVVWRPMSTAGSARTARISCAGRPGSWLIYTLVPALAGGLIGSDDLGGVALLLYQVPTLLVGAGLVVGRRRERVAAFFCATAGALTVLGLTLIDGMDLALIAAPGVVFALLYAVQADLRPQA